MKMMEDTKPKSVPPVHDKKWPTGKSTPLMDECCTIGSIADSTQSDEPMADKPSDVRQGA